MSGWDLGHYYSGVQEAQAAAERAQVGMQQAESVAGRRLAEVGDARAAAMGAVGEHYFPNGDELIEGAQILELAVHVARLGHGVEKADAQHRRTQLAPIFTPSESAEPTGVLFQPFGVGADGELGGPILVAVGGEHGASFRLTADPNDRFRHILHISGGLVVKMAANLGGRSEISDSAQIAVNLGGGKIFSNTETAWQAGINFDDHSGMMVVGEAILPSLTTASKYTANRVDTLAVRALAAEMVGEPVPMTNQLSNQATAARSVGNLVEYYAHVLTYGNDQEVAALRASDLPALLHGSFVESVGISQPVLDKAAATGLVRGRQLLSEQETAALATAPRGRRKGWSDIGAKDYETIIEDGVLKRAAVIAEFFSDLRQHRGAGVKLSPHAIVRMAKRRPEDLAWALFTTPAGSDGTPEENAANQAVAAYHTQLRKANAPATAGNR